MTTETSPARDDAPGDTRGDAGRGVSADHDYARPISDGPNARPRDEPIAQTEHGLPDDTARPVDISPEEEKRIARKILEP